VVVVVGLEVMCILLMTEVYMVDLIYSSSRSHQFRFSLSASLLLPRLVFSLYHSLPHRVVLLLCNSHTSSEAVGSNSFEISSSFHTNKTPNLRGCMRTVISRSLPWLKITAQDWRSSFVQTLPKCPSSSWYKSPWSNRIILKFQPSR
jgi:hypothetical protein